jgi:WD40 repeat protein
MRISPGAMSVAIANEDGGIATFSLQDGSMQRTTAPSGGRVVAMVADAAGNFCVARWSPAVFTLPLANPGELSSFVPTDNTPLAVTITDEARLAVRTSKNVEVWTLNEPGSNQRIEGQPITTLSNSISIDGSLIAILDDDREKSLSIWNTKLNRSIGTISNLSEPIRSTSFSLDGKLLAVTSQSGTSIRRFDTQSLRELPGRAMTDP